MGNKGTHDMRRIRVRFEGQVQGVGFRYTSRRIAEQIGATGWVRNEPDRSVVLELQGTDDQIARFFGQLGRAWGRYPINYIIADKDELEPIESERLFRVRR